MMIHSNDYISKIEIVWKHYLRALGRSYFSLYLIEMPKRTQET